MTKDIEELIEAAEAWAKEKDGSRAVVLVTFDHTVKACESNYTFVGGPRRHVIAGLGLAMLADDSLLAPLLEETYETIIAFQRHRDRKDDGREQDSTGY